MKKNYEIKEIHENVFAVVVPDRYYRAMLFLRVQEFYESPNAQFRGKPFSIWKYMEWYSKQKQNSFSYPSDWTGFNFPLSVALKCYSYVRTSSESPYDEDMREILEHIEFTVNQRKNKRAYVIGVSGLESSTFHHEMCHAFYHIYPKYKKEVDAITESMKPVHYKKMCKNLKDMGYTEKVFKDEVQAYTCVDSDYYEFNHGVPAKPLELSLIHI